MLPSQQYSTQLTMSSLHFWDTTSSWLSWLSTEVPWHFSGSFGSSTFSLQLWHIVYLSTYPCGPSLFLYLFFSLHSILFFSLYNHFLVNSILESWLQILLIFWWFPDFYLNPRTLSCVHICILQVFTLILRYLTGIHN